MKSALSLKQKEHIKITNKQYFVPFFFHIYLYIYHKASIDSALVLTVKMRSHIENRMV